MDATKDRIEAALIILYDEQKRLLLQHRTWDAERLPGYWAFFGGGIKDGETPLEAVCRETLEELRYKLKTPRLALEQDFELGTIEGHMWVYVDKFEGDKSVLELREGQGLGWYSSEETKELRMIEHDRIVVAKIGEYVKNLQGYQNQA
jgi:8-oxo-dGTP pyrophosphatase MutT (NUDIX family)